MSKHTKPEPEPCTCGRTPVVVRVRGMGWEAVCPGVRDCDNCDSSGWQRSELDAIESWNALIRDRRAEMKRKGARK